MTNRYFPFHALGLRCNPFRALTDDEWAEIAVLPDALLAALECDNASAQILGPRGAGKTTTLLALAWRWKLAGKRVAYEYLPEGQTRFMTDASACDVFLLDEAQRLDARERKRLLDAAMRARLVLGAHTNFARAFARRGLSLTTIQLTPPTHAQLDARLHKRLAYFALNDARPITFTSDAVEFLRVRFGGNLRALEYFLYAVFQHLDRAEPITSEQLRSANLSGVTHGAARG